MWKHSAPVGALDGFVLPQRPDPKGHPKVKDNDYYSEYTNIQRSKTLVHGNTIRFNNNKDIADRKASPIESYINECVGDRQQVYRLSQVIRSLKNKKTPIDDPLEYIKTFRKERFAVFMIAIDKRDPIFEKATKAMQLIMAGGEQIRHVKLCPALYFHILDCYDINEVRKG